MRIAFLLVVLAGAVFYSYIAFVDLDFLTRRGRLGPGFFPRIVGVGMVLLMIWVTVDALMKREADTSPAQKWADVVTLMALAIGYAVLLRLFGGFIATVIYLGVALSVLNRGRYVQNAVLTVAIPGGVYLLFDRLLNANMPPALIDLPF
ncbi:tripartite tricarboxylate transporter TctB family protein [Roseibacterium beibuensis]|uniref:DUF1468 domain-containing protein n=1 Tax=[Roseibacterium] beibuensis TaxID=1193142 RepID=A0ABP9L9D1_9RHOB|nr:tripartite tricarboxylate transporter TctB family protein [Roseibacterium beibuensis]MCS6623948.1 tripartite tricarboxylate transporter TctB family protein [Roseibacterium beibuensis]